MTITQRFNSLLLGGLICLSLLAGLFIFEMGRIYDSLNFTNTNVLPSVLLLDDATRDVPVIFLTAMNDEADEKAGFALGAVDYIGNPISGPILRARVKTQLAMKLAADFMKDKSAAAPAVLAGVDAYQHRTHFQIGTAARHWQGRHPRQHPAQAGQVDDGGI